MTLSLNIRAQYFGFGPVAGHVPGCPRTGSDVWEATRHIRDGFDGEVRETTFRFACHDCGAVTFEHVAGPMSGFEHTHASQVGYASRPERVAGLWLHPGPRLYAGDDRGPTAYYVTRAKARPREPGAVCGVVAWHLGPRGGIRWGGGLGLTEHGTVQVPAERDWTARRPAVAWIAAQLTATGKPGGQP